MAQLKDLIVSGATRLIGTLFASEVDTTKFKIPTSKGGTTLDVGTDGYILKTGAASGVYWSTNTSSTPSATTSVLTSVKSAGQTPTLGNAITADDITSWSAGSGSFGCSCTTTTIASAGAMTLSHGHTAPSLSYTEKTIPNVTAVGSMPTFNSGNVAGSGHTHTV